MVARNVGLGRKSAIPVDNPGDHGLDDHWCNDHALGDHGLIMRLVIMGLMRSAKAVRAELILRLLLTSVDERSYLR
jgi:hypothetical protein